MFVFLHAKDDELTPEEKAELEALQTELGEGDSDEVDSEKDKEKEDKEAAEGKKDAPKPKPSSSGKSLALKELGESDKKITSSLKSFLKKHQYTAPKEIFLPEEGGVPFPFVKLNSDYALLHIFKLYPQDQADGYLILMDISSNPIPIDTIGPFFNLNITGVAYADILADNENELIVNYEYDLVTGQTIYKKNGPKHMPFFQYNKGPKPPRVIDIDEDGKYEIVASLELEDTSKGGIVLGDLNQYWNDIYTFQNGAFFKNNKKFKAYLEKNVSSYKSAIQSINNSDHIQERVSFMDKDPTDGFIKDLQVWIATINGL